MQHNHEDWGRSMLTTAQRKQFEEYGFIPRLTVADSDAAARTKALWDELEAREDLRGRGLTRLHSRHLDNEFLWRIASSDVILDSVEDLLGPNVLLFGTRLFCKYPSDEKFVSWHQDTYQGTWGLEPPIALTVWYAIDDCDDGNGSMRIVPASHRSGPRRHEEIADPANLLRRGQSIQLSNDEHSRAVPIRLRSGEASIHDGGVIHSSSPNTSGRRRCGLAIRFVPTHVRQNRSAEQPQSTAILMRGRDEYHHFELTPWPFSQAGG